MRSSIFLFLTFGLFAQQPAEQPGLTIRTAVTNVIAPTTVLDRQGNFVSDLQPKDFKLFDNDKLQDIREDISFLPISLVVIVQNSWNTDQVLPTVKKVGNVIGSIVAGEQGEAAVVKFDHRIELMQDFTNDGTKLSTALNKINAGSNSARLNDAIIFANRMLKKRPSNHRRVILLISETQDRGSEAKVRDALIDLEISNTIVYPVNMSRWINRLTAKPEVPRPDPLPPGARPVPGVAPNTPTTAMQQGLGGAYGNFVPVFEEIFTAVKAVFVSNPQELYTKYTGGREENFTGLKGLEEALQKISNELRSQYLLSYNPNNKGEGGFHRIQVVVNRPGLTVRTRQGYWMAAIPE